MEQALNKFGCLTNRNINPPQGGLPGPFQTFLPGTSLGTKQNIYNTPFTLQKVHKARGTLGAQVQRMFCNESSLEAELAAEEVTAIAQDEYGSKPHHFSKQFESLQKLHYENSSKLPWKDNNDHDSKPKTFRRYLSIHNVNQVVRVRGVTLTSTEHTLVLQ